MNHHDFFKTVGIPVTSCQCESCQRACQCKPGWFTPNQISGLLEYFQAKNINQLLKTRKFAIDWYIGNKEYILVLAPNIIGNSDIQYHADPTGQCVFFKNKKCEIYEIRPIECALYSHNLKMNEIEKIKNWIITKWKKSNILEKYRKRIEFESYSLLDHYMKHFSMEEITIKCHCGFTLKIPVLNNWLGLHENLNKKIHFKKILPCGHLFDGFIYPYSDIKIYQIPLSQ